MATPSVLTVPSMYGDGILYSGPTVFSNELVTNGNFQTDTDWTKEGAWTISNGVASVTSSGNDRLYQSITLDANKKYLLSINVVSISSASVRFRFGGNGSASNLAEISTVGLHTFRTKPISGSATVGIFAVSGTTASIDNVSVKEITQGSDFDFTRATTGTRINEEGYIEDVPYNLATYSEDFSQGAWQKLSSGTASIPVVTTNQGIAPDGNNTADKIFFDRGTGTSSGDFSRLYFSTGSAPATMSVYLKSFDGLTYDMQIVCANTSKNISITSDWQRFDVSESSSGSNWQLKLVGNLGTNATSSILVWGAQLVKGDQPKDYLPTTDRLNLPRLNYPVYGGCPSLLVEPQRTNRLTYSNDLSQWANSFSTDESNVAISPEGIQNAGKLIDTTSTGDHYISTPNVTIAYDTITANSVFVKKGTFNYVQVRLLNATGTFSYVIATFNLDTGELLGTFASSGTTNASYKIEKYPNDWCRIILVGSFTNSNVTARRYSVFMYNGTSNQYTGTGNDFIYIYGAQIEVGSYATSYIPTSGSTVTRNEDKALYAGLGTTDTFNDSEGVLFIETEALVNEVNARGISINAGNGLNRVLISYPSSGNSSITGYLQSTAGSGAGMTITGIDTTQKHKVAIKYKLNDTSLFIDGVKRAVDTSVVMPVGLKQLDFSNGISVNTAEYEGNLNAIAVYKTALTDTELANLTSYNNHDLFIPYRSRMQMISADQELQCTEHDITRFL